jgi:hypothetical protein
MATAPAHRDEARPVAHNIAKLPVLVRRAQPPQRARAKHFRFSSNSGHIAAPHEPMQWANSRHHGYAFVAANFALTPCPGARLS